MSTALLVPTEIICGAVWPLVLLPVSSQWKKLSFFFIRKQLGTQPVTVGKCWQQQKKAIKVSSVTITVADLDKPGFGNIFAFCVAVITKTSAKTHYCQRLLFEFCQFYTQMHISHNINTSWVNEFNLLFRILIGSTLVCQVNFVYEISHLEVDLIS